MTPQDARKELARRELARRQSARTQQPNGLPQGLELNSPQGTPQERLQQLRAKKRLGELRAKRDASAGAPSQQIASNGLPQGFVLDGKQQTPTTAELAQRELARRQSLRSQPIVPNDRKHRLSPELQEDVNRQFQKSIDNTGALGRALGGGFANFAHDVTFGADDHISAAIGSVLPFGPERFGRFKDNLEIARQRREIQTDKAPVASIVGSGAGLLTGGAALAKRGLTLSSKAPRNALAQAGAAGGDAAIGAGLLAVNEGRNPIEDVQQAGLGGAATSLLFRGLTPLAGLARKAPKSPSTKDLKRQADDAFDKVSEFGATFDDKQLSSLFGDIDTIIPQQGLGAITRQSHPVTSGALSRIKGHEGAATLDELNELRKSLSGNPLNKPDARLSGKIRSKLDDFTANTAPAATRIGTGAQANSQLQEANALFRRQKKSEALDDVSARIQRSKAFTSGRKAEAVESQLRRVLNSKKLSRQFDKSELDQIKKIVDGNTTRGLLGRAAKLNPLENHFSLGAQGLGAALGGLPIALAAGGSGLASRLSLNKLAQRDFDELAAMIRNNSGQTVNKSQLERLLENQTGREVIARTAGISLASGIE